VVEVAGGGTEEWFVAPEDLGIARADLGAIAGASPEDNAATVRSVLAGEPGPARDVVCLNAGAAIFAAGAAHELGAGIERAREAIDSGAAEGVLERLIRLTSELPEPAA
jgi:anthranilate phosphoribosyltransferase